MAFSRPKSLYPVTVPAWEVPHISWPEIVGRRIPTLMQNRCAAVAGDHVSPLCCVGVLQCSSRKQSGSKRLDTPAIPV